MLKRYISQHIAKEVGEIPIVVNIKSDANPPVREAVQIGARSRDGSSVGTIDVEERVTAGNDGKT